MQGLKKYFEWVSKHATLLIFLFTVVLAGLLSFVWPVLTYVLCLPLWLLPPLFVLPFYIFRIYIFYYRTPPTRFKGGETVKLKGHWPIYFVMGYVPFSKKYVRCRDSKGETVIYHQDSFQTVPASYFSDDRGTY